MNNYICSKSVLLSAVTIFVASGCNWDPDALAGKNPRFMPQTSSSSSSGSCMASGPYEMRQSWKSRPPGATCEYPVGTIQNVELLPTGGVIVRVKKLSDGTAPAIQQMVFGPSYGKDLTVSFQCTKRGEAIDGTEYEIVCESQGARRISPVELASTDRRLLLKSLLMSNPSCSAQALYEAADVMRPCLRFGFYNPVEIDSAEFPPLWIEAELRP